jgi:thiol-disulfide isomerase/thioredoxin
LYFKSFSFCRYLTPYLEEVKKEFAEKAEWAKKV